MINILYAILVVLGIGGFFGLVLGIADKYLTVKEDPRIGEVTKMLPNANCGGCGYAGCSGLAEALVTGQVNSVSLCRPSKPEAKENIAKYLNETLGPNGETVSVKP